MKKRLHWPSIDWIGFTPRLMLCVMLVMVAYIASGCVVVKPFENCKPYMGFEKQFTEGIVQYGQHTIEYVLTVSTTEGKWYQYDSFTSIEDCRKARRRLQGLLIRSQHEYVITCMPVHLAT